MKPSQALNLHRREIFDAVHRRKTVNPRVFGSVSRGTDTETSDLDLLVDPLPGTTLFDLGGLQVDLEEMLGVSVDVVTPKGLRERYRERVLAEARPL